MHEVVYFDTPGFAEVSRFCLGISGLEWKNTVVDWDGYLELKKKGELPWGYLPIIRTPQGTIAESNALLRYTGALAGMEPKDLYVRAKVDEIVEVINGWRSAFIPTFSIDDLDEKIAARQALFAEGGKMDQAMRAMSKIFEQSTTGWLANTESMSIADVKGFMDTFMMFSGQFDGITADMLAHYPSLLAFHEKMSNEPLVKNYYEDANEARWVFRPNAFEDVGTSQHI
tara:strand:- start:247 stop:930 length:684 start_codon:yes stop_codon:yes gene_type:complete